MAKSRVCKVYFNENSPNFIVEYRGNFKEQIDKLDYACGDTITDTLGIVSVPYENLDRLLKDVPAIVFVETRSMYVLQDISPTSVDEIEAVKRNPYLALTGRGVLVGMVDTGIDYLNEEFIREDGTSRILSIWDQSSQGNQSSEVYLGTIYDNEQINLAIKESKANNDPYKIVPIKDEIGHGTKIAGIIGARGYNKSIEGIANDCDFVVVKLLESANFQREIRENGLKKVPVYNASEGVAAVEYLKKYAVRVNRPMVIYIGIGSSEGSHDGTNLSSRYLTSVADTKGIVIVAGVGNEGDSQGHTTGNLISSGEIQTVELNIPREMKFFTFNIWVQKPNKMDVNVISPSGEYSGFIESKMNKMEDIKFYILNTTLDVRYRIPEHFTGHEVITLDFRDIKPGIWKIQLKGEYIVNGRYDIWLQPKNTLPEGTVFLNPDPYNTLTVPSTARKVVTVSYYNSLKDSLVSSSGRGFNTNGLINPDIAAAGIDILTTQVGGGVTTVSGSSAATGIVTGTCALMLQWGIVDGNDITMNSIKLRSYLIYGADRPPEFEYPDRSLGYGRLNLMGSIKAFTSARSFPEEPYEEGYINNLFTRIPKVKGEI